MTNIGYHLEDTVKSTESVEVSERTRTRMEAIGTLRATVRAYGGKMNKVFHEIAYVLNITTHLLSVSSMRRRIVSVLFRTNIENDNRGMV